MEDFIDKDGTWDVVTCCGTSLVCWYQSSVLIMRWLTICKINIKKSSVLDSVLYRWSYSAIQCNTMQCNAMQCNAMQYNTIQYNTIQYNTIQYNTMQLKKHLSCLYICTTSKKLLEEQKASKGKSIDKVISRITHNADDDEGISDNIRN